MKLYKYILSLSLAIGAMMVTSCNDFLDRSPQGQFTEDDDPNALVNGKIYNVYTMMRKFDITAGTPAFAIHSFRSEDAEKGSTAVGMCSDFAVHFLYKSTMTARSRARTVILV